MLFKNYILYFRAILLLSQGTNGIMPSPGGEPSAPRRPGPGLGGGAGCCSHGAGARGGPAAAGWARHCHSRTAPTPVHRPQDAAAALTTTSHGIHPIPSDVHLSDGIKIPEDLCEPINVQFRTWALSTVSGIATSLSAAGRG